MQEDAVDRQPAPEWLHETYCGNHITLVAFWVMGLTEMAAVRLDDSGTPQSVAPFPIHLIWPEANNDAD